VTLSIKELLQQKADIEKKIEKIERQNQVDVPTSKDKNALIICDAWDYFSEKNDRWINRETKAFCTFLNFVCNYERNRGTQIYHDASGHDIANKIILDSSDTVLSDINDIPITHECYYFAGFHLDICVSGKADALSNYVSKSQIGIALNLSLLSFESQDAATSIKNINHHFYWWTRNGFSPISL